MPHRFVVFSDLDGTLLDHDTYSWAAAGRALDKLEALGIPVILATSKTAAEVIQIRAELGLERYPAIVENGAGRLEPNATAFDDDSVYARILAALGMLPSRLRSKFTGFHELGVDGIARVTGLPKAAAERAGQRQFSEPGVWDGTDEELEEFVSILAQNGVKCRYGGRFPTLSLGASKARQMEQIVEELGGAEATIALGDAPNDIEMIEAADHGVIVANAHGKPMPELAGEADGRIRRTDAPGPEGWSHAILSLLNEPTSREGQNIG